MISLVNSGFVRIVKCDEKRDVAFWKEPEEMCQSILTTGSYAVLPPSIAHKPQMRAGKEACHVKKCVAKVKWQA